MSILIKGVTLDELKELKAYELINIFPVWVEQGHIVEVKTPHGRLIDTDDLHEKMHHEAFEVDSEMQKWDGGCWIRYKVFENCESDCPTVIEAEE